MAQHFFGSLAQAGGWRCTSSERPRRAHTAEAAYKAVGRALAHALRQESAGIPSTKGVL
jgi:imidazoleglycerol phosphate dehydratase HisB